MNAVELIARRLKLRTLLFCVLLGLGIVPLAVSSVLTALQNREIVETEQKTYLTRSSESLSSEVSGDLRASRKQLLQLGSALLAVPGPERLEERLGEPWVEGLVESFFNQNPNVLALRLLDVEGVGLRFSAGDLEPSATARLDEAFEAARGSREAVYRFDVLSQNQPAVVIAQPVKVKPTLVAPASLAPPTGPPVGAAGDAPLVAVPPAPTDGEAPQLVVEALLQPRLMEAVFRREAASDVGVFLVDQDGELLWSEGSATAAQETILAADLVRDFASAQSRGAAVNVTSEILVDEDRGGRQLVIARISPVEETGWGVVVHKPAANAFAAAQKMISNTVLSSIVVIVLALLSAGLIAGLLSKPIQRLATSSHEIALGNFGQRVPISGLGTELTELAADFNRMSAHVEEHIAKLEQAARANQELFIGSLRAFAAAIDAKDPYTRGHSERVATYSRTVARHLNLTEEFLHRIWVAALLHDVGKIGVEDRVLKKGGVLTNEEYELMKQHPVIGADILTPIEQLREMLPAVRWHHENWNGRGYPDGLKGEEIPLIARIVSVADTFDAITTNRPYQRAYTPQFAVETITKLTGTRFDAKVTTAFLRAFQAGDIVVPRPQPVPDPAVGAQTTDTATAVGA
jgi:HD-GYP domain-containing protein (c-di-GMP phosphodiesterase class II)